jgi:hypothetical protein
MCVSVHPLIPSLTFYSETISIEEPDAFSPLLDILTNPDAFPGMEELSQEGLDSEPYRPHYSRDTCQSLAPWRPSELN